MQQKYTIITIFMRTIILQKIDMQYPYNPPFPSYHILSVTSNNIYAVFLLSIQSIPLLRNRVVIVQIHYCRV